MLDLPGLLFTNPLSGRPSGIVVLSVLISTLAAAPIGMLLALLAPGRSVVALTLRGLALMVAVAAAEAAMLSATPYLVAIGYRTLGIALGVIGLRWLRTRDPHRLLALLARLAAWLVLPYLAAVLFVNGLLTPGWRTVPEAMAALDRRGLLPFWHWYIVAKERTAQSLVAHLITFAPIGTLIWLRRGASRGGPCLAAKVLAKSAALAADGNRLRWFKPGLQPDFSDIAVAGIAACRRLLAAAAQRWPLFEQGDPGRDPNRCGWR